MAYGKTRGVEILVHTSAPSLGHDDRHYRAMAMAYVAFEPQSQIRLLPDDIPEDYFSDEDKEAESQLQQELLQASSLESFYGEQTVGNPFDIDTQESYRPPGSQTQSQFQRTYLTRSIAGKSAIFESPQASFGSIFDNAESPVFRGLGPSLDQQSADGQRSPILPPNQYSWSTPPSVVADSQPTNDRAIPEFSSPTRVLELYLQQFDSSNLVSTSLEADVDATADLHRPSQILIATDPTEEVPLSITSISCRRFEEPEEINGSSPAPSVSALQTSQVAQSSPGRPSAESFSFHNRSQSDPLHLRNYQVTSSSQGDLPTNIHCAVINSEQNRKRKLSSSSSSRPSSSSARLPSQPPSKARRKWLRRTPNEIHPRPPLTSARPLSSNITPSLAELAHGLEIIKRYQPTTQTRPLRPLERGYWRVAVSSWSSEVRSRAWEFLEGYIGKGKAGWGVWCCQNELEGSEAEWKIYCWGEVVGHVYLLLYLASERWIKGVGAQWVDGGGEVVVTMPVGRSKTL